MTIDNSDSHHDEPTPLNRLFREVLDLVDQASAGTGDEHVEGQLRELLRMTGHSDGTMSLVDLTESSTSDHPWSRPDSTLEAEVAKVLQAAAREELRAARAAAEATKREVDEAIVRAASILAQAETYAAEMIARADAHVDGALDRSQSILVEARKKAGKIVATARRWAKEYGAAELAETVRGMSTVPYRDHNAESPEDADSAEQILAGIWGEILGVQQVGSDVAFFELGGDSLAAIELANRAKEAGLDIEPRDVFNYPTLGALAAKARTSAPSRQSSLRRNAGPASPGQIQRRPQHGGQADSHMVYTATEPPVFVDAEGARMALSHYRHLHRQVGALADGIHDRAGEVMQIWRWTPAAGPLVRAQQEMEEQLRHMAETLEAAATGLAMTFESGSDDTSASPG